MKKVYLSLTMASFLAGGVFSQVEMKPITANDLNLKPVVTSPNAVEKALGITIYENNFDTPSDWTIDNSGQTGSEYGWSIDAVSDGWWSTAGISSTSGGNFAELSNGDPTATTPSQALNVTYTLTLANPIDVTTLPLNTSGTDQVSLQFEQYGALFNDEQLVQISTDGGANWITVRDNRDHYDVLSASGGSPYPNADVVTINLAPYITGSATNLLIRFQWTTAFPGSATNPNVWITYGWYIDDIKLITNPDNDISLSEPTWGSLGVNYYQIPTSQVAPIDFSVIAQNDGTATQTNVMLNVDVNSGAFTGSSAGTNIAPNTSDTLELTTPYTPAATVGTHNVTWDITQTQVDDVPSNNQLTAFSFDVTDYIYARDNGVIDGSYDNNDVGMVLGNFFDIFGSGNAYSADIYIESSTDIGSEVVARIYELDPNATSLETGLIFIDESLPHTVTASDLNQWINLDFAYNGQSGAALSVGDTYLVAVVSDAGDAVIGTAGESYPQTSFVYDVADDTWYYTTNTPAVRLNMDPASNTVGLEENNQIVGVNIFPNPVSENLTINYSVASASDVTVEVVDITGKVIATVNEGAKAQGAHTASINTSAIATGVYYANIYANGTKVTKKFVKK